MARLVVKTGKETGTALDLTRASILGRGETVQLRISDAKASREHCRVFQQAGAWVVADLNSRNGITVNGVKTTRKNLRHGDVIAIGLTQVSFESDSGDEHATGEVFPAAARAAPAPKKSKAAAAKEKAFAEARAASKSQRKKPGSGRSAATSSGDDEGTKISDKVLQYSNIDARKAGVMDYDISQMSGTAKFLILLAGLAILALAVWGVALAVG